MSSTAPSKPPDGSSALSSLDSLVAVSNRRGSINSLSASSTVDKEQLAHALDKIHTSASQCDSLTTFNDFAPPPEHVPPFESRGTAGDLVQHGLSGLYSRFREAVGGASPTKSSSKDGVTDDNADAASRRTDGHSSRPSISSLNRAETATSATSQPTPSTDTSTLAATASSSDLGRSQMSQPSKPTSISLMSVQKLPHAVGRSSLPTKATSAVVAGPTLTPPVSVHRDSSRGTLRTEESTGAQSSGRRSLGRSELQAHLSAADSSSTASLYESKDASKLLSRATRDDTSSVSNGTPLNAAKATVPPTLQIHTSQRLMAPSLSESTSLAAPKGLRRKPAVIDKISRSRSPAYPGSRESSLDRGTAEASPINTSAHNFVSHVSFSQDPHHTAHHHGRVAGGRIPGTAPGKERASDQMSAQLDKMRRQVLSKEFWMKDDTVKECFLCQTPFTAFRRKHHCRTCGCIFDSKCTTVVPGERFGVQGSLRVCKNCLEVISRRLDGSASDDSGDEPSYMPRIFGPNHSKTSSGVTQSTKVKEQDPTAASEGSEDSRPVSTPMMAIPATRRVRDSNNRSSAVLEIDGPQLSRPGSSRSLKSLGAGRPQSSAGHKRHHSKHGFLGRFKAVPPIPPPHSATLPPPTDDRAPFRKGIDDDSIKKSKLPAFHDDNIIDPDLADYMSDDSSGDEQMSIFATMSTSDLQSASFENEKSGFTAFGNASRKHRYSRTGEKSISGMSYVGRSTFEDVNGPVSLMSHRRSTRRRNLSIVSGSVHHHVSPRPKSAVFKGASGSSEMLLSGDMQQGPGGSPMMRSESIRKRKKSSKEELNQSSLKHVDKLLHQLLTDAGIPSPTAWQRALVPILLQLTDDVTPDVAKGEDMDIRHYVKLKRIPGGKPSDTAYVSGVVFTKNLALKSMPRRIMNPRIVLVTFPIEYQRHQQHFMSLQPVIEQEKEFLRVVVQRITNLRPHVVLAQKSVSGIALQYLSEANISVAYNVKDTVIEAVARCAEAEIVETLDMLALPVRVGRCASFEVRTFVNNDYSGRKKSYIFLSGCKADLGCTIALRGANNAILGQMKQIMEFMVYVVYNLKLETSLLRDECIEPPDAAETSLSSSVQALNDSMRSLSSASMTEGPKTTAAQPTLSDNEPQSQTTAETSSLGGAGTDEAEPPQAIQASIPERSKLVSLHEHHSHASHDTQVPDDVPMPTFYSDMVAKYETKILSASPYVKFKQPYLLMKAREQERRLLYLRRLRDQDLVEEGSEKSGPHKFQLIKPEMVEKIGQTAPRQIMEILHAVHDAEYDKALFNYQTQTRQWETYIQGNLDLFDPYSHQNIVVLYSVICTETKIPCIEPSLIAINFYDEQHVDTGMDPDCTLGQYIEDLAYSKNDICNSNGCEKMMVEHHRTYVHDQHRITVFVEQNPNTGPRKPELGDGITMWTYCKLCKKDSEETAMSEATFKYSFGKYLELIYWGRGLRLKSAAECPHDHYRDHVRYFTLGDSRIRIHWDPIDLLEIVVPRGRITWKVVNDLRLKNEIYTKMEERWCKFMSSVKLRLKSIRIDSVLPEKAASCKAEVDRLTKKAQEEQPAMVRQLQSIYVNSKYYEVVPFNSLVRDMLEKAGEWDQAFAKFEADFLGDKDMRQLTIMQLKKMFTDNESKESLTSTDANGSIAESDERPSQTFSEADDKSTQPTDYTTDNGMASTSASLKPTDDGLSDVQPAAEGLGKPDDLAEAIANPAPSTAVNLAAEVVAEVVAEPNAVAATQATLERVEPLDLAGSPSTVKSSTAPMPLQGSLSSETGNSDSPTSAANVSKMESSQTAMAASTIPASPTELDRSPPGASLCGPSLSAKIDQMHRDQVSQPSNDQDGGNMATEMPRQLPERVSSRRKSATSTSPPLARASSHPTRPIPRTQSSISTKLPGHKEVKVATNSSDSHADQSTQPQPETAVKVDKKLSDRLGLTALKHRSKGATSSIPRLVHKKRESRVSALARHFEQLSREFEKERIRDRKNRAANFRLPRARLPRTTTKAIVQVYDDVNQAFEEPAMPSEQPAEAQAELKQTNTQASADSDILKTEPPTEPPTPTVEIEQRLEDQQMAGSPQTLSNSVPTQEDNDDTSNANTSQVASDDEGGVSDLEASVPDEFLPGIKEIADALEPSSEIPLELPKHQKTSLMKYLTNFWAERSASGWPPLEYPVNSTDHIFVDSDIIVREDEPSSVIALALNSDDYKEKLANIRREAQEIMQRESEGAGEAGSSSAAISENADWTIDETEQEKSLLRATGTHLKYQFKEGAAVMTCKIFYAEQFDALRRKCGIAERIVESLSRCLKWDSRGGKTKSVFLKTLDDRLVLKSLSPVETSAFLRFAPGYFSIMAEALFHDLPSVIAKMLGFVQVIIKNPSTGTDTKLDLLITENLFYDRIPSRIFDLKGSMRNRKIQSTGEQNEVLLDENMVEYIYESPLFAREHSKKLLRASVWNDTLFLARQNVMDYSLMIAVDEERKELVVGIIDCIRTYTWDKKLESWIKDRGFAGGGRNRPTVTSPKEYKSRFREAMARYILQAPNCWHLFNNPQLPAYYGRARFEEPESLIQ